MVIVGSRIEAQRETAGSATVPYDHARAPFLSRPLAAASRECICGVLAAAVNDGFVSEKDPLPMHRARGHEYEVCKPSLCRGLASER